MTKRTSNKTPPRQRARPKGNNMNRARKPGTANRPGGKLGVILGRLQGKTGGTLDELVEATGWQKHSVRGALSRLRGRGFAIDLEEKRGRKAYRLALSP